MLRYDNPRYLYAELAGHYVQWSELSAPSGDNPQDDALWDLNMNRTIGQWQGASLIAFTTAHNLFNASPYWHEFYPNPERWIEAGLRARF